MIKCISLWIGVLYIAISGGGGCNLYSSLGSKPDQAIIDDVNISLSKAEWDDALNQLASLSAAGQTRRDVQVLYANAYAGRGGLRMLDLANTLNGGISNTFFLTLLTAFRGSTVTNFNDEVTAESFMLGISYAASGRTLDENMFMIFLEMAKLGTLFAAKADPTNKGVVAASFRPCNLATITSTQGQHVATAMGILNDSIAAVNNPILTNAAAKMTAACSLLGGACGVYKIADVTAAQLRLARTAIGENNAGFGLAVSATNGFCEIKAPYSGLCTGSADQLCP